MGRREVGGVGEGRRNWGREEESEREERKNSVREGRSGGVGDRDWGVREGEGGKSGFKEKGEWKWERE